MKENNKGKLYSIINCIIIVSVVSLIFYSINTYANTSEANTIEEVTDEYIKNMKNQDFDKVLDMIKSKDAGYDAKVNNFNVMNKYVNEPDKINQLSSSSKKDVLLSQYEYIKCEFGEDSWDNITYKIIKKDCPSKKEEFINTESQEVISEKEAVDISDNYWKEFAKERGLDYNEFLSIKEYSGELNEQENMNILIAKELGHNPPISVNYVDEYDYFVIEFYFNGKNVTKDDVKSFRISVDNKDGIYKVNYGFRWSTPLSEENMRDI